MFSNNIVRGQSDSEEESDSTSVTDESVLDVLQEPKELCDVHPLQPKWVFWLSIKNDQVGWNDSLRQQCTINTVEDFTALKHRILPPSRLPGQHINYIFFKEGIKPAWGDPNNVGGGTIDVLVSQHHQHTNLDRIWYEILMVAIGAQFGDSNDQICGIMLRIRAKVYAISLWIRDARQIKAYGPIIETLQNELGIGTDPLFLRIVINQHPSQTSRGNGAENTF